MCVIRSILAGLAGLASVLAIAATVPVGWVAHHVADENGYVTFTSDLVADPAIRSDVVQIVTDDVVERTGVSDGFAPGVRTAVQSAAATVVDSAVFRDAFADAQRQSHRALFGGAEAPVGLEDSDQVLIDLAPAAQTIVDSVTGEMPVVIDAPDQLLVAVGGSEARRAVEAVDRTPQQTALGTGVAAIAAGLSLLLARRRTTMFAWLGAGTVAAMGAVHLIASGAVPAALGASETSSDLAGRVQQRLADAALSSLDEWLFVAAVLGAAAVLIGLVARAVAR